MRLTLRNLLRFLDQTNLRSIERSRLEQLVDESEKADAWIKRIDSLKRNKGTAAPAVTSKDPSVSRVVAYLDTSMSEQETIEFERSMLSSDVLLAEVASCHEVRESVINELAPSIPILLRQSVYDIARGQIDYDAVDLEMNPESSESDDEEKVAAVAASMKDLPYVDSQPDAPAPIGGYSIEGEEFDEEETVSIDSLSQQAQKRSKLVLGGLLLLAAALLGVTYWLGTQSGNQTARNTENPDSTGSTVGTNGDSDGTTNNDSESQDGSATENNTADNNAAGKDADESDNDIPGESLAIGPRLPDEETNSSAADDSESETAGQFEGDDQPLIALFPATGQAIGDNAANMLPARPNIGIVPANATDSVTAGTEAVDATPVATLVGDKPTLQTKMDAKWFPVKAGETSPGEMFVLPGTKNELSFGGIVSVTVEGPARFLLRPNDAASGSPVIRAIHGHFTVRSIVADADLIFEHGKHAYHLVLPVSESTLDAEFSNYLAPGADPRSVEPAKIDLLVATRGRATVKRGDQSWSLPEANAFFSSDSTVPEQIRAATTGVIEMPMERPRDFAIRLTDRIEKNSWSIADSWKADSSLMDYLTELKNDLRQERRFAALSWLAFIGNYEFLIDFLNDEKNRNNWRSVVEAVRGSIQQNPEYATALFDSLAQAGAAEQPILFKLLLGYPQEELANGADEKLVELLDHDSLCVRILTIERIREITGGIAYGYQPNADRKARRRTIEKQWKRALKKDELRYTQPPGIPAPGFVTVPPAEAEANGKDASGSE